MKKRKTIIVPLEPEPKDKTRCSKCSTQGVVQHSTGMNASYLCPTCKQQWVV
jgi:tRNA(Ile2) C34 agmatinyltransferase TiaS